MAVQDDPRFLAAQNRTYGLLARSGYKSRWEDTGPFSFVQMADTQFGMLDGMESLQRWRWVRGMLRLLCCFSGKEKTLIPVPRLIRPPSSPVKQRLMAVEMALARRAVSSINAMFPRPAFAVVCGDLVHSFPATQSEEHAAEVHYTSVLPWDVLCILLATICLHNSPREILK